MNSELRDVNALVTREWCNYVITTAVVILETMGYTTLLGYMHTIRIYYSMTKYYVSIQNK